MRGYDIKNNEPDPSPLAVRLFVEASAAIISALTVAPAISIVDKAIVSNASGRMALFPCILDGVKSFVMRPAYFFRQPSFIFIWGVYSGTYIVANSIEAIYERSQKSSFYPKFIGSSFTNVSLSVLKDKAFARMFGQGDPRPMAFSSMTLFAARDSSTILASFSLPELISNQMQCNMRSMKPSTADNIAQLVTPVTMQIFSTPLHLLGLDLYNRPNMAASVNGVTAQVVTTADRIAFIEREYVKTTLARMSRIFPAFGVGGVVNKYIRQNGNQQLRMFYKRPTKP